MQGAVYHRLQDARIVSRATGNQIGWAFREPARKVQFTMDSRESVHDALWRDGKNGYEWVRPLYFDKTDGYQIEETN